jgi:Zn-dependent M28 family amino/carboxypeptidase
MWVTEEVARRIAQLGKRDLDELRRAAESRDFRPVPLGVTLRAHLKTTLHRLESANVLGELPGSDAELGRQRVVVTAHHDHLGVKQPKKGDAIYNGAFDNASGVAGLLELAEALAQAHPTPKRTILFAAVGAEESGLLGSEYLCAHLPVPAGEVAADLNFDGVNVYGRTRDVQSVGVGRSSLDRVLAEAARAQGRSVTGDQFPDRGAFYRSDQFNFARIGVPVLYLKGGIDFPGHDLPWGRERVEQYTRERYHQPNDQIDATWVLDGAVDDLRLAAVVALRIADAKALPTWTPGDEFAKPRPTK